jgi:hypothetical protein
LAGEDKSREEATKSGLYTALSFRMIAGAIALDRSRQRVESRNAAIGWALQG